MAVELNHTIVHALDSNVSAAFWCEVLGLDPPKTYGPFVMVESANGVSFDFLDAEGEITRQHYAFLVTEDDFDEIFGRIVERNIGYWADPAGARKGQINRNDGGRGVYFLDPNGHALELLTRPYGSGSAGAAE
jgi:catechol 2,3-dioxygenase-like lactoylglutathione lyase family enzyme